MSISYDDIYDMCDSGMTAILSFFSESGWGRNAVEMILIRLIKFHSKISIQMFFYSGALFSGI